MADQSLSQPSGAMPTAESYSQLANPVFEAELALRTAAKEAAFFLPHLRPGMRLLDLGSGPGSITLGFAEIVSPGEVAGQGTIYANVQCGGRCSVRSSLFHASRSRYRLSYS